MGRQLPFHLDTATDVAECTHDLTHSWLPQHQCRNNGAMDHFVKTHTLAEYEGPEYGVLTMGYYTRADLPYYYALADAFTICDGYHCSVMGPTHPNRLMSLSGTIDPGRHPRRARAHHQHIAVGPVQRELADHARGAGGRRGRAGRSTTRPGRSTGSTNPEVIRLLRRHPPLLLAVLQPGVGPLPEGVRPDLPGTTSLRTSARGPSRRSAGSSRRLGYDEHPPAPPALGEWFTNQVLQALVANPEVWSKTVLFFMYDENDGFFDHVPPPVAPPGTPGEYVTVNPLPTRRQGTWPAPSGSASGCPCWSSRRSAGAATSARRPSTTPRSSGSWRSASGCGRRTSRPGDARRSGISRPPCTWHGADTSPPSLPSTSQDSVAKVMSEGCQESDILEFRDDQPPYPLPAVQTMPVQEPGQARRLPVRRA